MNSQTSLRKLLFCGHRAEITEHAICHVTRNNKLIQHCPDFVHNNRQIISEYLDHYKTLRSEAISVIKNRGEKPTDELIYQHIIDSGGEESTATVVAII